MDLLGADEFECGGVGGEHEKESAVSAMELNDAEFNGKWIFHPW